MRPLVAIKLTGDAPAGPALTGFRSPSLWNNQISDDGVKALCDVLVKYGTNVKYLKYGQTLHGARP